MSAEDQYPVNYACASDDGRFIQSPEIANARKIGWIYEVMEGWRDVEGEEAFLELLEGKEEDVWLWKDGDEEALPEPVPWLTRRPPYVLAAQALQTRQASGCVESREMADMRQRVQSESPAVRLAAIAWLAFTSKAMKKQDSKHGRMDREEWDLWGLIWSWWVDVYDVRNLPEASTEEFEKAIEKEGHTCHTEPLYYGLEAVRRWLYVQSLLFPERAGAAVNLMVQEYGDNSMNCTACCK